MKYVVWIFWIGVLGFMAVVGMSNTYVAIERGKQKRTMAGIRAWSEAIEDHYVGKAAPSRKLARMDGWDRPYIIRTTANHYSIRSLARDGKSNPLIVPGGIANFDCDIVYADGSFVQFPEGL